MIVFTLLKIWLQHQKKITFSMGHIVIVQKFSGTHFIFCLDWESLWWQEKRWKQKLRNEPRLNLSTHGCIHGPQSKDITSAVLYLLSALLIIFARSWMHSSLDSQNYYISIWVERQVWFGDTVPIILVWESSELCLQNQTKKN